MHTYKFSKELLEEAVTNSRSFSEVVRYIGAGRNGTSLTWIKKRVQEANIDTSHFVKYFINDNFKKRTAASILIKSESYKRQQTKYLRRALLEIGRNYSCEICGNNGEHNSQPLTLQIDHIDGEFRNNTAENLRFICPNCHSQTANFAGKKTKVSKVALMADTIMEKFESKSINEISLELNITPKTVKKYIKKLNLELPSGRVDRKPLSIEIINSVMEASTSFKEAAEKLNISQGSLKNKCKKYGINIKTLCVKGKKRGYCWITNGVEDKFHNNKLDIPHGWRLGKSNNLPPRNSCVLG